MPTPKSEEREQLRDSTNESIEKAHNLIDEMKIVQEYENSILGDFLGHDDEPPFFRQGGG
jgi:hypothetical protein